MSLRNGLTVKRLFYEFHGILSVDGVCEVLCFVHLIMMNVMSGERVHFGFRYIFDTQIMMNLFVSNVTVSVSEVINIYVSWFNTQTIYECHCGYFLTFDQFSRIFATYIVNDTYIGDDSRLEMVFKVSMLSIYSLTSVP